MTVRTAVLFELFSRCRSARPDWEWIEGFPGDDPPRRRTHIWEYEGDMMSPASPDVYYDEPAMTIHVEDDTGGMTRREAMQHVEDIVTVLCDVIRTDPTLGGEIDPGLATYISTIRGPYSEPNPVEGNGYSGRMSVMVTFQSHVSSPSTYSLGQP